LRAELEASGYAVNLQDYYGTGTNVWTTLDGANAASPTIVIGAHFDSVSGSPGANDNATGVALVLAAARYLHAVPCRTVNVIFVFFDQEEVGLLGSDGFAAMLADSSLDVQAVHTVDQMGWDMDGDRAIELERPSPGLSELYAAVAEQGGYAIPMVVTQTGSTDHVSFRKYGFPAIGLTEEFVSGDTTPYYHQPGDTFATVDFDYLRSTSVMMNYMLAHVSVGDLPPRVLMSASAPMAVAVGRRARMFDSTVAREVGQLPKLRQKLGD